MACAKPSSLAAINRKTKSNSRTTFTTPTTAQTTFASVRVVASSTLWPRCRIPGVVPGVTGRAPAREPGLCGSRIPTVSTMGLPPCQRPPASNRWYGCSCHPCARTRAGSSLERCTSFSKAGQDGHQWRTNGPLTSIASRRTLLARGDVLGGAGMERRRSLQHDEAAQWLADLYEYLDVVRYPARVEMRRAVDEAARRADSGARLEYALRRLPVR